MALLLWFQPLLRLFLLHQGRLSGLGEGANGDHNWNHVRERAGEAVENLAYCWHGSIPLSLSVFVPEHSVPFCDHLPCSDHRQCHAASVSSPWKNPQQGGLSKPGCRLQLQVRTTKGDSCRCNLFLQLEQLPRIPWHGSTNRFFRISATHSK